MIAPTWRLSFRFFLRTKHTTSAEDREADVVEEHLLQDPLGIVATSNERCVVRDAIGVEGTLRALGPAPLNRMS